MVRGVSTKDAALGGGGAQGRGGRRPIYVVLENDALVAADLIQALEARGACSVLHFSCPSEIRPALGRVGRVEAAFLEMGCDEAVSTGLAEALAARGARLVLTRGEDSERVTAHGWTLLPRPFTERMVHDLLS